MGNLRGWLLTLVAGVGALGVGALGAGCAGISMNTTPVHPARPLAARQGFELSQIQRDGHFYFSGQPSRSDLDEAARRGIALVINLRTQEELAGLGFDEKKYVRALGLDYESIPFTPASFSKDDLEKFIDALANSEGPVWIHCSSGNRVGGLWASYLAVAREFDVEEALIHGRAAGLSKPAMEEAFRRLAEQR